VSKTRKKRWRNLPAASPKGRRRQHRQELEFFEPATTPDDYKGKRLRVVAVLETGPPSAFAGYIAPNA